MNPLDKLPKLLAFMVELTTRIPAKEQPFHILISKEEETILGKSYGYNSGQHLIRFEEKEHYYLEMKYRDQIEELKRENTMLKGYKT